MVIIQVSVTIHASIEKVWSVVSDLDNEPKFWKGTKEIKNLSMDNNTVLREVTIAFRDSKCMQKVSLYPMEKIHAEFTKGIIKGTKTINLTSIEDVTKLETIWDIKLSGMMEMFTGIIKKHIQSGTEQALDNIKKEIER